MNSETIRKANAALIAGKKINSYKLPKKVIEAISNRKYTKEEINAAFAKVISS